MLRPGLIFILWVLCGCCAYAQRDTVRIGAFINDLYDIQLSDNSFSAEFWVWFNYANPALRPLETLEIPNAKSVGYELAFTEQKNGLFWAGKKVNAVVKKEWEIEKFPFDRQVMVIELEESDKDAQELCFVADTANTKLDANLRLSNWEISDFRLTAETKKYATTYGDPGLQGASEYPHASLSVTITRKSRGLFLTLFTGLYVAFLIASLVFFIDPVDVDPRFGLSVGGLFAAVGNKYIVDSILPQTTVFTLVDKLHIITFLFILICIVCSVVSLRIWKNGYPERSRRFDRRAYAWIAGVYLAVNIWVITGSV